MREAISALPYAPAVKVVCNSRAASGRKTTTSMAAYPTPIRLFARSATRIPDSTSKARRAARAYLFGGANAYEFTAMAPEDRVKVALEQGAQVHPQYRDAFETGFSVAWARAPFTLGCAADWTEEKRAQHYDNLCAIDGRIALAGEHASYIPAWQEGAILSALDCVQRLHARAAAP